MMDSITRNVIIIMMIVLFAPCLGLANNELGPMGAEDVAMQKAMERFWQYGYKATTLGDLLSVMAISKSSFCAAR